MKQGLLGEEYRNWQRRFAPQFHWDYDGRFQLSDYHAMRSARMMGYDDLRPQF